MIKRWIITCICCCCIWSVQAQSDKKYTSEQEKIKEIKLNEEYYFSDVTAGTKEEALDIAYKNLLLTIQQDLPAEKEVEILLKGNWKHVALPRMDKQRVFAYVYMGDVNSKFVTKNGRITGDERETLAESTQDTTSMKMMTAALSKKDSIVVEKIAIDTVLSTKQSMHEQPDTFVRKSTGNKMLDQILTLKKISEVQAYFMEKKNEGKMMFGKMDTLLQPEEAYILVFSRAGEVCAVLDKGKDKRRNFLTDKEDDKIDNYQGKGIIWFSLY